MKLNQLLADLSERGVQLWADGDRLRIRASWGALTPELRDSLAEHKEEIILLLRQNNTGTSATSIPLIVPMPDQRYQPFPLTPLQQGYWVGRSGLFELGNVAARFYCDFDSNLDVKRLSSAWQQLIERHDMLRAVVLPTGEQQILEQVPPYEIEVLDLHGLDPVAVAVQLEAIRDQMFHQELLTDQWPLFEIRASRLDDQRIRLHFSFELLILDGTSLQILIRELGELCQNPKATLTPLELSFRDYVLANVAWQDSIEFKQALDYWHNRIPTLPPAPELPLAKNPGSVTQHQFVHLTSRLEAQTWLRLKNQATQAGLTPTLILCAAYAEVLSVWSKISHFTIIFLYSNRLALPPQVNDLVGNFNSTILLEVDNSGQDTFKARAKRLQRQFWNDREHSMVSGIQVVREMNRLQGEIPRAAMPVTFGSELSSTSPLSKKTSPAINQLNQFYSRLQVPQVFLDYQIAEEANGDLIVNWDFVEELFPQGLVQEMFDAYVSFLHRLASEEDVWQETSLQLVPPAQMERQASMNATNAPVEEKLLHTLFTEQVSKRPAQSAVVCSTFSLTYKELYRRSNQLGNQIRHLGACPNMLVAVAMEKGWEQVVGVLAILMAGAAYVSIDPGLPQERRRQLLDQSEVQLVLTQSWLEKTLEWPEDVHLICVDTAGVADTDVQLLEPVQQSEDLAYVIYTSGSTGLPKGVMIDHRGAVNTIVDINQRFSVGPDDKVLALSSLNFDLSVYDIFGTLAAGGTIVFPDASATKDPAHWLELMMQEQVTVWNSVPALMQMLVEYAVTSDKVLPSSLRLVLLSGDWLPLNLPPQLKILVEGIQVISLGGATEASIWSILYPIETVDPDWKSIPYGRPMVNQRFYVLNEALESCPVWVPGLLYIGGIGLAKGYWRDQQKTRASFITHPRTGERLYCSGDLGRYLPDGNIEFLGRKDFQVKVQGYRIECGEIEATLQQHPAVQAVVVTAMGERQGDKRLVVYVVPSSDPAPTPSELRDFMGQKLPQYMVPAAFIMLDALPLTPNGKVDRKALPEPAQARTESISAPESERTLTVMQIGQLVASVLKVDQIDANTNLLEAGASSLDIIRIANQLDRQLGFRPKINEFFRLPTVSGLAWAYEQQRPQIEEHRKNFPQAAINGHEDTKQAKGRLSIPETLPVASSTAGSIQRSQTEDALGLRAELAWIESSGIYRAVLTFLKEQLLVYMELSAFGLDSSLVGIQPNGSKPPFFCVHPSFGDVLCFLDLARHLGVEQPFYGLQALGLDGKREPYTCIEDMAGHYIKELRVVQPQGPYFLGGWSSGGIVALEMAKQLESKGQEVKLVALLDSLVMTPEKLNLFLENLRQLETDEGLISFLEPAIITNGLSPDMVVHHMRPLMRVFQSNLQALLDYLTKDYSGRKVYSGRVIYFQASEQIGEDFLDPALELEKLAVGTVEIQLISGNHLSMLRQPHVSGVAEHLKVYLHSAHKTVECYAPRG